MESVKEIALENGSDPQNYSIDASLILKELETILHEDYSQTLMISAVLGQLVEASGKDRLPPPAFFAYLEILSMISDAPKRTKSEPPDNIDETTTRVIELATTLVSVICKWNESGVVGISKDCPSELTEVAKSVHRKTTLLQTGMWICVSCGRIVDVKTTRALMCTECDEDLNSDRERTTSSRRERERTGYGMSSRGETIE